MFLENNLNHSKINLTTCHSDAPVKRARVLISARVAGAPNTRTVFSRGGVGAGSRNLLRLHFLRPKAESQHPNSAFFA